ncbi:MAG: transposase family protein [Erysipelotrichaceae bacterium]|nr:transposase family protein [Erysipelotrichaceae bacterium]
MNNVASPPAALPFASDNTPIASVVAENDIMKFFNLESNDIKDFSITHAQDGIYIHIRLNVKPHVCPVCRKRTQKIKDYVPKKIIHSVLNGERCYILYDVRRYKCPHCGKQIPLQLAVKGSLQRLYIISCGILSLQPKLLLPWLNDIMFLKLQLSIFLIKTFMSHASLFLNVLALMKYMHSNHMTVHMYVYLLTVQPVRL